MEACTCEAACPCIMLNDPTEGYCTAVVGWHIDEGNYGGVPLDGLNVVVALHSPGNMADGNWKAALYLDDGASAEQQGALGDIWGGQAGGHPGELAKLIGEVAGVAVVPLDFETDGKRGRIGIGDLGGAEWEPIEGQNGQAVTVENHPLAVAPGYPAVVGKASRAAFKDCGIEFDVAGRQTMTSPFSYAGP
ncbi:MAG: DUF1326 domain-containing protein [Rubrobacter sp.]|nr:DUF1326 domain-containing protein [Rubrobacter sp.]